MFLGGNEAFTTPIQGRRSKKIHPVSASSQRASVSNDDSWRIARVQRERVKRYKLITG